MNLFETLSRLTAAHGVSGDEGEIRALIRELAEPYADDIREDAMGNLIVHKQGAGPRVLFSAHMDSIGVMATNINKEGFVRFGTIGGFMATDLVNQTLRFSNGTTALCCVQEEKLPKFATKDLYLDLGAKDEKEAKTLVQPGDTATYTNPLRKLAGERVCGSYLDNRAGCLILLETLARLDKPANDCYFLFSTQEEVGCRGAKPAAFSVDPAYGIAVDVTDVNDTPGNPDESTCELGKGAGIKVLDSSVICQAAFVEQMKAIAKEKEITVQTDIMLHGGTDAGNIRTTRSGVVTGGISLPCRYIHTAQELCDMTDLEACVKLSVALCEKELAAV